MYFDLDANIYDYPIVAFDTETSGPYPLESEIIELGAVKWFKGQVVDQFQTLLRPSKPLEEENIKIHGITNDMVKNAPFMSEKLPEFLQFINETILVAHHAPFDVGFLTVDIEKNNLKFPQNIILCSSLLSRALLPSPNHKLQTLIKEYQLTGGSAHRAYDDAFACFEVLQKSVAKLDPEKQTLKKILEIQQKQISWSQYAIYHSHDQKIMTIAKAISQNKTIDIVYEGGKTKNKTRPITPKGIVRNPDGDYVHAVCEIDKQRKRFYLSKILDYSPL